MVNGTPYQPSPQSAGSARRLAKERAAGTACRAIPKTFPHSMMSKREIRQRIAGGKLDQLDLPTVPCGLIGLGALPDDERKSDDPVRL